MSDLTLKLPELPDSKDTLFASAEDWWNNACLNYFLSDWTVYAIGYKDAADILVNHVDDHGRRQDILVYPIVFLYRQYLELALKDLIRQARRLLDDPEPYPNNHRIDQLWALCDSLLEQVSPGDSVEYRKEIGRLIREFAQVDPLSMAFRYPEDKDGNPSLPGIRHINVRNVRDVIGKITVILDGADAQIDEYLSLSRR
jgi:hypothetical protein